MSATVSLLKCAHFAGTTSLLMKRLWIRNSEEQHLSNVLPAIGKTTPMQSPASERFSNLENTHKERGAHYDN